MFPILTETVIDSLATALDTLVTALDDTLSLVEPVAATPEAAGSSLNTWALWIGMISGAATVLMLIITFIQVRRQRKDSKEQWKQMNNQLEEVRKANENQTKTFNAIKEATDAINNKLFLDKVTLRLGDAPSKLQQNASLIRSLMKDNTTLMTEGKLLQENEDFRQALVAFNGDLNAVASIVDEYLNDKVDEAFKDDLKQISADISQLLQGEMSFRSLIDCLKWVQSFTERLDHFCPKTANLVSKL